MLAKGRQQTQKSYIGVALVICVVFLVCCALFLTAMIRQNHAEDTRYLSNAAAQNCAAILTQLNGDFQTLNGIAVCISDTDLVQSGQLTHILQKINDNNSFIRMGYASPTGDITLLDIGGAAHAGINLSNQDFFRRALLGQNAISNTMPDPLSTGQYINYYAVPVSAIDGTVQGVLCAVNSAGTLREILDAPILNGVGFSNLVDSRGDFVIRSEALNQSDFSLIHTTQLEGMSPEEQADLSAALMGSLTYHFTYEMEGKPWLGVVEPLGMNDWHVFSTISQAALRARYGLTALGLTVIVLAAGMIFVFLLSQQRRFMLRNQTALMALAYQDPLTGCRNFSKFQLDAAPLLNQRGHRQYVVWHCDLKNFKYFNDMFGYQTGDQVLQALSALLDSAGGSDGLYCRISADKFAGIMPYEDITELEPWFQSLVATFHRSAARFFNRINLELSAGFYLLTPDEKDATLNAMVNWANMAERTVKQQPGSTCAFFSNDLRSKLVDDAALEADGKSALENGEFQLYFQPKVNIQADNRIVGAEVLARWLHPEKGLISPAVFIPIFEDKGLIQSLDRYMFERACQWMRRHLDCGGRPINLAVNVSRLGLLRQDFVDWYAATKARYAIPDDILELEFTESILLGNDDLFLQTVEQLQSHGFICSMDDFGAGYSSLNVLKNLPINVLKLDILFFRKSASRERERIVISSIISMAQQLNIKTIAEGVEAADTVDFLREVGCNVVQGYIFAKPMPMGDFDGLLTNMGESPLPYLQ